MKAPNYIIRQAREQKGLSQAELAAKAGLSPTTIMKSERGADITPKTWAKIKDALGIVQKDLDMDQYVLMF